MALDKKRKLDSKKPNKTKKPPVKEVAKVNKKIIFEENLEEDRVPNEAKEDNSKKKNKQMSMNEDIESIEKRWFEMYDGYNTTGELVELKEVEITELRKCCTYAFESEFKNQLKKNPTDAKWLETALEKGTSKDRAHAGALLVQTNPICNLAALETLISMTKLSNKSHLDVIEILTELLLNSVMPTFRKLIPISLRGADWKNVKKLDLEKSLRDKIFAYWHVEDALRDLYFTFLSNLSNIIQTGNDHSKEKVIVYGSKLFMMIPEKEAYLLSILVNKLGDPNKQVASKALYHLTDVVRKHTAMCSIIVVETEKLLFRNNISLSAQHYALSFLASITRFGDHDSSHRLINICFSFFKINTEKGEINSRTMQSILACLKRAISKVKRDTDIADIVKPELLNTIYRLIHLADISIACQALNLMLEITENAGESQDRFYNTLYKKLLDPRLADVGSRISSIFFYIIHRAIQNDPKNERAQAFIKRLLHTSFYFPPAKVCGVLIVVNKVLRSRRFLMRDGLMEKEVEEVEKKEENEEVKVKKERQILKYDAFHRSSEFAGAQYTQKYELVRYLDYFHPTVKSFAQSIINNQPLTYYGDPLRDFSLGQFLDRFSFKNPKKPKNQKETDADGTAFSKMPNKRGDYVPFGSRGHSVHELTKENCTEDEKYIFDYLDQKREKLSKMKNEDVSDNESVGDDEFEKYLDNLGAPGREGGADLDYNFDFLSEFEKDMAKAEGKKPKKTKKNKEAASDEDEDLDDWANDNDDAGSDDGSISMDGGSISMDDDEDEDEFDGENEFDDENEVDDGNDFGGSDFENEDDDEDEEEDDEPKSKKTKQISDKDFQRKLKTADMNSLFTAADNFSDMLEKNAGSAGKSHGTLGEIFNQDKSSEKQMSWERARMDSKSAQHGKKKFGANKQGTSSSFKGGKVSKKSPAFKVGKAGKKGKQFSGKKRK